MKTEYTDKVAQKWDSQSAPTKERSNFWNFPEICGPLNVKICGSPVTGVSGGVARRLAGMGPFERAVSVGCGRGTKETALLRQGTVKHFTMYDLSPARLKEAATLQAKHGMAERAELICADAFASVPEGTFDLVYWASSLHHMPDVYVALEWSWKVLKPGGVLAMWEYIGPTRWQFSDEHMELMNRFRAALPADIRPEKPLKRKSVSQMIARDPSEAADSGSILPALSVQFPGAEVIMLGGGMYGFGMSGIWPRLTSEHAWVLDMVMSMDAAMTDHHMHACAFARKGGGKHDSTVQAG